MVRDRHRRGQFVLGQIDRIFSKFKKLTKFFFRSEYTTFSELGW